MFAGRKQKMSLRERFSAWKKKPPIGTRIRNWRAYRKESAGIRGELRKLPTKEPIALKQKMRRVMAKLRLFRRKGKQQEIRWLEQQRTILQVDISQAQIGLRKREKLEQQLAEIKKKY